MTEPTTLKLTPKQLAAMLVVDACRAALQTGANQLGAFLGMKDEADILVKHVDGLKADFEALEQKRAAGIVVAQPADVKRLVTL